MECMWRARNRWLKLRETQKTKVKLSTSFHRSKIALMMTAPLETAEKKVRVMKRRQRLVDSATPRSAPCRKLASIELMSNRNNVVSFSPMVFWK